MPTDDDTTSPDPGAERKAKNAASQKAWYAANRVRLLAKSKAHYEANKANRLAKAKAYKEANPGKVEADGKAYRAANKARIAVASKTYREANPEKIRERQRKYRASDPEKAAAKAKAYNFRKKYGLMPEQYEAMMAACDGRCPCCKVPFSEILGQSTLPVVDHCHTTGKVRGIICRRCNILLGHSGDQSSILRACARYLDQTKKIL